jgi:uncharacterized membrane protein
MFYHNCRRIREELANQNAETNNLTNKLDRVSKMAHIFGTGGVVSYVLLFLVILIFFILNTMFRKSTP